MEKPEDNPHYNLKPTKIEFRRRVDIVESLVIDCASIPEIMRYFAEKEGLQFARRTVERYVHIVEQRIRKAGDAKREVEIVKAKRRFERCFARAMSGNKKSVFAAIAAQKAINNLLGLNAPRDSQDEMSPQQLAEEIAIQRKELERVMHGPTGLRTEILELFQRYSAMGQDSNELLQKISQLIEPPTS